MVTADNPIRVIVVEDDPYARDALLLMLQNPLIRVIHSCSSENEGFAAAIEDTADIMLVDLALPGDSKGGIKLIEQIRLANIKVHSMILTAMHLDGVTVRDAIAAGAHGFYRKVTMPGEKLIPSLIEICLGGVVIEPDLLDIVMRALNVDEKATSTTSPPHLTPTERKVLSLINQHYTHQEIARALNMKVPTVKTHLRAVREKFANGMNSHQVALYAALLGLL